MQISLGSRGDYSVRAVLFLARHPGRQPRRSIAEAMDIPAKYLPQILVVLVRAGVIRSTNGRGGGYELARAPDRIFLREIIEVVEGPIRSQKCVLRTGPCYWQDACAVNDAWVQAENALIERLSTISFAGLARMDKEIELRSGPIDPMAPRPTRIHDTAG